MDDVRSMKEFLLVSVLLCLQTSRSTSRLSQRSYNSHYLIDEYAESIDLDDSDDVTTSNRTEATGFLALHTYSMLS